MIKHTWGQELYVVGLKYRFTKQGRSMLARMLAKGDITGCKLVREPDNPKDENAIVVMLPNRLLDGKQLGYLMRESAAILAPRIDAGSLKVVTVRLTGLTREDDYNTGIVLARFQDIRPKLKAVPAKRQTKRKRVA